MKQLRSQQRADQVERLTKALTEYRTNPPALVTRPAIVSLARRFWVHPKTLEKAIVMMAEGE